MNITPYSRFARASFPFRRLFGIEMGAILAFISFALLAMYEVDTQNALVAQIKAGTLSGNALQGELAAVNMRIALAVGGMISLVVVSGWLGYRGDVGARKGYLAYLATKNRQDLEVYAKGLETDPESRALVVGYLSHATPGWSYRT